MKRPKVVKLKRTPKQEIDRLDRVKTLIYRLLLKKEFTIDALIFQPKTINPKIQAAIDRAKTDLSNSLWSSDTST